MTPRLGTRIGLALARPRAALALAGDRANAGRSGSDLLIAVGVLLAATQLRWIASAVWLAAAVDLRLGASALVVVLTHTLTIELGLLVVAALAVWLASGPRRELGRAFDLACVAVMPLVAIDLVRLVVERSLDVPLPLVAITMLSAVGFAWMGGITVLACLAARRAVVPDPADLRLGRSAGWGIATVAALGVVLQISWLAGHLDTIRPLRDGAAAPPIALARIGPHGALGERVTLPPGKIAVVDFWATWCGPCLAAMPRLDRVARAHPEIEVIAVDLDDPVEARALFDQRGYAMTLVADDGQASQRYGVATIPHTVVIDRAGKVRRIGGDVDLDAEIRRLGQ